MRVGDWPDGRIASRPFRVRGGSSMLWAPASALQWAFDPLCSHCPSLPSLDGREFRVKTGAGQKGIL